MICLRLTERVSRSGNSSAAFFEDYLDPGIENRSTRSDEQTHDDRRKGSDSVAAAFPHLDYEYMRLS
jgi:hypothetical protein